MIFTFYSYKGGVGRSMALAEVAERLASRGLKVLAIDFDLEAPGLERYFFDAERSRSARLELGLIDLIQTYKHALTSQAAFDEAEFQKLEKFRLRAIHVAGRRGGSVDLMTAGRREPAERLAEYAVTVRNFDWQDFFTNWRGDLFFDWLRDRLTEESAGYDVVLIDSRTGVTEMGGICAYQLADVVVLLCAPNYQNLEGTRDVVRDFTSPGVMGLRRGRPLEILALPARIDQSHPKKDEFLTVFARELGVDGMPKRLADVGLDYAKLALPYLKGYAVTERQVGTGTPDELSREVFDRLADALTLLARDETPLAKLKPEARSRLLEGRRSEEVELVADTSKASAGYDVFLDYGTEDRDSAYKLRQALQNRGLRVFDPPAIVPDQLLQAFDTALEYSRVVAVCFGRDSSSSWRERLLARARSLSSVQILPILLPGGEWAALRSFGLAPVRTLDLTHADEDGWAGVEAIVEALRSTARPAQRSDVAADVTPYVGPRPYSEDEAKYFAGREQEIERLQEAVLASDVVFLSGPAQVGKTSLVRAGLLPKLRQSGSRGAPSQWGSIIYCDLTLESRVPELEQVLSRLSKSPGEAEGNRLVVLDSADTFLDDGLPQAARARIESLVTTIEALRERCKVLIVWRDLVEEPLRHEALKAAHGRKVAQITIQPLAGDALRSAIEQPALRAGHLLEPGLTQRLIESAGTAHSAIFQIQLALAAIWPRRQRGWLSNKNLDDEGHLAGVFQRRIEAVLSALTPAQRRAAEVMFKSLAMLDTTLKLVPLPGFWRDLASVPTIAELDSIALRDRLAGAGLIDLNREIVAADEDWSDNRETDARVTLVRPNAMAYFGGGDVIPDVRFFMWRRGQFANDLQRWLADRRSPNQLLRGSALAEAGDWLGLRRAELSGPERELIEASMSTRDAGAMPDADDQAHTLLLRRDQADLGTTSRSALLLQVDEAVQRGDFREAKALLQAGYEASKRTGAVDSTLVQRLVLVTYKSKVPSPLGALEDALSLLEQLEPETSNDPETLGLAAVLHKRLWSLTEDMRHLDQAIRAYERSLSIRGADYYSGINFAFLLNVRSARNVTPADAVTDFVLAVRARREVVAACKAWLSVHDTPELHLDSSEQYQRYWVLATLAEAQLGLGDESTAQRTLSEASALAPDAWMTETAREQLQSLRTLLADSPLRYLEPGAARARSL